VNRSREDTIDQIRSLNRIDDQPDIGMKQLPTIRTIEIEVLGERN
jgi:hypothetical protein